MKKAKEEDDEEEGQEEEEEERQNRFFARCHTTFVMQLDCRCVHVRAAESAVFATVCCGRD